MIATNQIKLIMDYIYLKLGTESAMSHAKKNVKFIRNAT